MRNVDHKKKLISILVLVTFVLTLGVNIIANILPLNNMTTGQVSDRYSNLFAPVSFTFLIWIVIYILLSMYTVYQFKFNSRRPDNNDRVVRKVNIYFILSNIANALWIVCWHYNYIFLSVIFMFIILIMLISIRINITHRSSLSKSERTSMQIPFSVYLAWITVASIANVTTLLVSLEWDRFGYSESAVTVFVIILGLIISVLTIISLKDIPFALVIIWAFGGILYKHISPEYFDKSYFNIMLTLIVSIIILIVSCGVVLLEKKTRHRRRS